MLKRTLALMITIFLLTTLSLSFAGKEDAVRPKNTDINNYQMLSDDH